MSELDGLAGPLAEVIEFCASCFTASNRLDIHNIRRMKREDSLHTLVIYDSPHSEGFIDAATFAGDYYAGKYLNALFVAFYDSAPHIYRIAYFEMRYIFLEAFTFGSVQQFCFHRFISYNSV